MELPCLAFHRCGRSTQLFSASEHKRIINAGGDIDIDMDEVLAGKVVCPTAQGHLLVRDPATLSAFLWNPRNGDKFHLPPLRGVEDRVLMYSHCLLSDEPTAPGCVVLLVEPGETSIWYVHLGLGVGDDDDNGSWVRHDYDIGEPDIGEPVLLEYDDDGEPVYDDILICSIAACRGKFYFHSSDTELGVLEFCPGGGPVFSSVEIDDTVAADGSYGYSEEDNCPAYVHLVESDGELYMVTLLCRGTARTDLYGASVHRMDFAERRWRKVVDGLGGRVFLLSPFYSGASCRLGGGGGHGSSSSLRQDCVYVVCAREKALLVFDVKERTIETTKLDELPASDKEFWVLPAH